MFNFSQNSLARSQRGRKAVTITEPTVQISRSRETAQNRAITLKIWNLTSLPFCHILADANEGLAVVFQNEGKRLPHAIKAQTAERGNVTLTRVTIREDSPAGANILSYLGQDCGPGETVGLSFDEASREELEALYGEDGVLTPVVGEPQNPANLTGFLLSK